jgi:hypothetical protein
MMHPAEEQGRAINARFSNATTGKPCTICGITRDKRIFQYMGQCSRACFRKDFWNQKVRWANLNDRTEEGTYAIRVDGHHYVADLDAGLLRGNHPFRGFGGSVFYVHFIAGPHVGRFAITNNMWHQGDIPKEHADMLFDNAVFMKKEDWYRLNPDAPEMDPRPFAP